MGPYSMSPKVITSILVGLLLLLQYPLWFGKGGVFRVKELENQLTEQNQINDSLRLRNQQLQGDVGSLSEGFEAVEERARHDFGMVREGELFIQLVDPKNMPADHPNQSIMGDKMPKPQVSKP